MTPAQHLARTNLVATCAMDLPPGAPSGSGWIHVLPAGTFSGCDGRTYRLSTPDEVIAASRQAAGRCQIPVDYEHQIDLAPKNGQPAPAAGWIAGMQARPDGVWGFVNWTARAAEHLARREYRYLSPVFAHTPDGRITRVLRAALVNNPNLDQLTALASMETNMDPSNDGLADLRQLLGLAANADILTITAKVREVLTATQSADVDPSRFVPIGDFERVTAELNRINQGVSLNASKAVVEQEIAGGRLPPFLRDWGVALCGVNKPAFDAFVARTGPGVHRLFEPTSVGRPFPSLGDGRACLSDEDQTVAAALGHSPEDFRKNGRS